MSSASRVHLKVSNVSDLYYYWQLCLVDDPGRGGGGEVLEGEVISRTQCTDI
jgi:hypothetical protein